MNSIINTDNVDASVEVPTLDATLSTNTLIGQSSANSMTASTNPNTLIGSIGNGVIVSGIRSIYVNSIEQTVIGDTAYISLSYNILTDKPTIPTKTSDLINDSGFINSGYVTTNEFTSLSNQVGTIENNITNLNNDIEETQADIEEINEELTNKVNQTDFNNLQTQVTTNTNNIGTNTSNIQANTSNITTLTNIVDAQSATITSMTSLIEDNSDNIETLQTDVSSINTALSNKVDTSTFNVLDAQVQTNTTAIAGKQDTLVSGTNIKTINNQSLLGSGDISISGGQATDVQINGTSITSNNTANIETNSTYDATTNKIATMSDLPVIPTNVSSFTNDAGYVTNTVNNLTNYTLTSNLATVATSGDYNDLTNLPTIPTVPTNVSAFTNDAGYVTNTNYANSSTGGVVKLSEPMFNIGIGSSGNVYSTVNNYTDYQSKDTRSFISKGTLENVLTGKGLTDSGWQNLTLSSGVTVGSIGGTPQCRRIGKMVYIRGSVAFTASSSSKTVATIPDGYRPPTQMYKMGVTGGTRYSRMYVATGGGIGVDWIYNANGTQVTSGSIAWYDINISYLID